MHFIRKTELKNKPFFFDLSPFSGSVISYIKNCEKVYLRNRFVNAFISVVYVSKQVFLENFTIFYHTEIQKGAFAPSLVIHSKFFTNKNA